MKISWMRKKFVDMDVANDATHVCQSVIAGMGKHFLWHDIFHWITATSYKTYYHMMSLLFSG